MSECTRAQIEAALSALPVSKMGIRPTVLRRSLIHNLGPDECWPWAGALTKRGYGLGHVPGIGNGGAHVLVWRLLVGPVPAGCDLDHVCHDPQACEDGAACRHRRCVNPRHLKPVSRVANVLRSNGPTAVNARKTHCKHGHEFTAENTAAHNNGYGRRCRTCSLERVRTYRAAKKETTA